VNIAILGIPVTLDGEDVTLPLWQWEDPTEVDAFPATPDGWADAKGVVLDEYADALGKEGLVLTLSGYVGGNFVELYFDPPIRVRVTATDRNSILNDRDGFIDPQWNVEVIGALPPTDKTGESTVGLSLDSVWINGKSVRVAPEKKS
jgi:hypothetical protein